MYLKDRDPDGSQPVENDNAAPDMSRKKRALREQIWGGQVKLGKREAKSGRSSIADSVEPACPSPTTSPCYTPLQCRRTSSCKVRCKERGALLGASLGKG